jgi:hypothetical protein
MAGKVSCPDILSRFDRDDRLPKIPNDSLQTRTLISEAFQNHPILYQVIMILGQKPADRILVHYRGRDVGEESEPFRVSSRSLPNSITRVVIEFFSDKKISW